VTLLLVTPEPSCTPQCTGMMTTRGLWEIEEARYYFCRWAKFAGLNSRADAMAVPVAEEAFAEMAKCGAFEDIDPDTVRVAADH
jgi:hypothetical protein